MFSNTDDIALMLLLVMTGSGGVYFKCTCESASNSLLFARSWNTNNFYGLQSLHCLCMVCEKKNILIFRSLFIRKMAINGMATGNHITLFYPFRGMLYTIDTPYIHLAHLAMSLSNSLIFFLDEFKLCFTPVEK